MIGMTAIEGTILENEEARVQLASWLVSCILRFLELTATTYKNDDERTRFLSALSVEIASALFVWPASVVWMLEHAKEIVPELAELSDELVRVLDTIDEGVSG